MDILLYYCKASENNSSTRNSRRYNFASSSAEWQLCHSREHPNGPEELQLCLRTLALFEQWRLFQLANPLLEPTFCAVNDTQLPILKSIPVFSYNVNIFDETCLFHVFLSPTLGAFSDLVTTVFQCTLYNERKCRLNTSLRDTDFEKQVLFSKKQAPNVRYLFVNSHSFYSWYSFWS